MRDGSLALPRSGKHGLRAAKTAGFTLIEVTLAVVVISLGLLTLFGLGHLALRNAKAMEDDTRAAMLAEDIFASLRTVSENLCASNNPAAWNAFWCGFAAGTTNLPLSLATTTSFSNQYDSAVRGDGHTNELRLFSWPQIHNTPAPVQIPEWSARYWMQIESVAPVQGETNVFKVSLNIAPLDDGETGAARSFLTLFAEHGTLP